MIHAPKGLVALTCAVVVCGCTGWQPAHLEPGMRIARVEVETRSREFYDVRDASVECDSVLVGIDTDSGESVQLALSEILSAGNYGVDPAKTTHLVAVVGVVAIAATFPYSLIVISGLLGGGGAK